MTWGLRAVLFGDGVQGKHIRLHELVRAESGAATGIIRACVKDGAAGPWTETWTWNGELFDSREAAIAAWEKNERERGATP